MRVDRERYEKENFYLVDVDQKRIVIYVHASAEPTFLFQCPQSVATMIPWEVMHKVVHTNPMTAQLHFEFTRDPVLPQWYSQKRVCHVDSVEVIPAQGKRALFSYKVLVFSFRFGDIITVYKALVNNFLSQIWSYQRRI